MWWLVAGIIVGAPVWFVLGIIVGEKIDGAVDPGAHWDDHNDLDKERGRR